MLSIANVTVMLSSAYCVKFITALLDVTLRDLIFSSSATQLRLQLSIRVRRPCVYSRPCFESTVLLPDAFGLQAGSTAPASVSPNKPDRVGSYSVKAIRDTTRCQSCHRLLTLSNVNHQLHSNMSDI